MALLDITFFLLPFCPVLVEGHRPHPKANTSGSYCAVGYRIRRKFSPDSSASMGLFVNALTS